MAKCIVVYDDNCGMCVPLGFDQDCEGALSFGEHVALFADANAARKAIAISVKFAELQKAQGKIPNTDFLLPARKHIRILSVATEPKIKRKA